MHAAEREGMILRLLETQGFVSFQQLDRELDASPATIRRDLERLESSGRIVRVRGGARLAGGEENEHLSGVPFHENVGKNRAAKAAIGRAAALLCHPGESVIIDGGSTTLQMCPHIAALKLHVLTNSLHIASALLPQAETRLSVPAGNLFREQNIILSPFEEDGMSRYHASRMFMGAAAIGRHGLMQTDTILTQAEQRLIARAEKLVLLVDSTKFAASASHVVCPLDELDTVITDDNVPEAAAQMIERAGVELIVVTPALKSAVA